MMADSLFRRIEITRLTLIIATLPKGPERNAYKARRMALCYNAPILPMLPCAQAREMVP
jgi:hypothetical protein